MGYKDSAGSIMTDKWRLLTKMRSEDLYDRKEPCPIKTTFVIKAVDPAFPGADRAGLQKDICTTDSFFKFIGFDERSI
jgi:hypothetical protein